MNEKDPRGPRPAIEADKTIIIDAADRFLARSKISDEFDGEVQYCGLRDQLSIQPDQFVVAIKKRNRKVGELLELDGVNGWKSEIIPSRIENNDVDESFDIADVDAGVVYRTGHGLLIPALFVTTRALRRVYPQMDALFDRFKGPDIEQKKVEGAVVMNSWYALGQWLLDKLDPRQPVYQGNPREVLHQSALIARVDPGGMLNPLEVDKALLVAKFRIAGGMVYAGLARYIASQEVQGMTMTPKEINQLKLINRYLYENQARIDISKITALSFALGDPVERQELQDLMDAYSSKAIKR